MIKVTLGLFVVLGDKGYFMVFDILSCLIENKVSNELVFKGFMIDNIYILDLDDLSMHGDKFLVTESEDSW